MYQVSRSRCWGTTLTHSNMHHIPYIDTYTYTDKPKYTQHVHTNTQQYTHATYKYIHTQRPIDHNTKYIDTTTQLHSLHINYKHHTDLQIN